MALVIIQWGTISSRMLCGTRGASKETVSVQRRRSAQPQDCEGCGFRVRGDIGDLVKNDDERLSHQGIGRQVLHAHIVEVLAVEVVAAFESDYGLSRFVS